MLEKLLKRSYVLKAHPEKIGNYLIVRMDVLGIRILGEMVYGKLDEPLKQHHEVSRTLRREMKAEGLEVMDIKDYHPPGRILTRYRDVYRPKYICTLIIRYWESSGFYTDRIVAYRPITKRESDRLIRLIMANKEKGIGSGLQ